MEACCHPLGLKQNQILKRCKARAVAGIFDGEVKDDFPSSKAQKSGDKKVDESPPQGKFFFDPSHWRK